MANKKKAVREEARMEKQPWLRTEKYFAPTELRIVWNDNFYKDFATLSLNTGNYDWNEKAP